MCQLLVDLGGLTVQGCPEPLASRPVPQPSASVSPRDNEDSSPRRAARRAMDWPAPGLAAGPGGLWAAQPACSPGSPCYPLHSSECLPCVVEEAEAETCQELAYSPRGMWAVSGL